jgi:CubicO group peptidase (beta-lactamase class C family)
MKFFFFALGFASISVTAFAQTASVTDRVTKAFQERAADQLLKGISVGYISPDEMTNLNFGDITSEHARFEIGSISKSFAGLAIAKLSVDGKLDLEAPLAKYIPELMGSFIGTVTAHRLATHSAQLVRDMPNGEHQIEASALLAFLKNYKPTSDFPVGVRQYSNLGFDVLALLISRITNETYETYIQQLILKPRGMNESGFLSSSAVFPQLVSANDLIFQSVAQDIFSDLGAGAGGIYSNVYDFEQFLLLNLHPEINSDLSAAVLLSQKLGLGWDSLPGELPLWKNGAENGYTSMLKFNPVAGTGVIVFNHSYNIISTESIADIAMGGPDQFKVDKTFTAAPSNLFVGRYINDQENFIIETSLSSAGFLNAEVTAPTLDGTYNFRLRTFDGVKFDVYTGFNDTDYVTFTADSTGLHSILHYFNLDHYDSNQKPVYVETILSPAPTQLK